MSHTSWKTIAADLDRRILSGELSPGDRLPSGEAIARDWGVNRNTAHRAIEELQRQGLVVRHRGRGTVVAPRRTSQTGTVALLADCYAPGINFPSVSLIHGIQDGLGEKVNVVIAESKGDAETEVRQLQRLSQETDGIIVYPTAQPAATETLQRLAGSGFPLVVLDRVPEGVEADAVLTDNEEAARHAVRALRERGHRHVGFLSFHKLGFGSVVDRHRGFVEAVREDGIDDPESFVRWLPLGLSRVPEVYGQVVADALFSLRHGERPITALFCVEDAVAVAVLDACTRAGIVVPEELEIATFSDWQPRALGSPWNVHRIAQRNGDIGAAAASLLTDRMAEPGRPPRTIRVPADFLPLDVGIMPDVRLA